jgi:hypothetical protein
MKIPKRENALKLQLHHTIEESYPELQSIVHQQVRGGGHPDMSLSGFKRTIWYEIKHATPYFESPGLQEWMCQRLEKTSRCRYIIFVDAPARLAQEALTFSRCVIVVQPQYVVNRKGRINFVELLNVADFSVEDHDVDALAAHLYAAQSGTHS